LSNPLYAHGGAAALDDDLAADAASGLGRDTDAPDAQPTGPSTNRAGGAVRMTEAVLHVHHHDGRSSVTDTTRTSRWERVRSMPSRPTRHAVDRTPSGRSAGTTSPVIVRVGSTAGT
jgi:hypothetical protein